MRRIATWVVAIGLVAMPGAASAQESANDTGGATRAVTPEESADFARTAAVSGLFEIEASRLALERSTDPEIEAFAQTMITDHTRAGAELKATAGKLELPTTLDAPHRQLIEALRNSGADFDRIYVEQQITAHKEAVSLFTAYASTGPNGALKGLAAKLLPTLQHHQEMAGALKPA